MKQTQNNEKVIKSEVFAIRRTSVLLQIIQGDDQLYFIYKVGIMLSSNWIPVETIEEAGKLWAEYTERIIKIQENKDNED